MRPAGRGASWAAGERPQCGGAAGVSDGPQARRWRRLWSVADDQASFPRQEHAALCHRRWLHTGDGAAGAALPHEATLAVVAVCPRDAVIEM